MLTLTDFSTLTDRYKCVDLSLCWDGTVMGLYTLGLMHVSRWKLFCNYISKSKIAMLLQLNATLVTLRYYLYIFFPFHFIFDIKLSRLLIWSGKMVISFYLWQIMFIMLIWNLKTEWEVERLSVLKVSGNRNQELWTRLKHLVYLKIF